MNDKRRLTTRAAAIAAIAMLPFLAACGDGDDGDDVGTGSDNGGGSSTGCNLLQNIVSLLLFGDVCNASGSSGGGASGGSGSSGSGGTRPARIDDFSEYEPNSSLDIANVIQLPVVSGDTASGIDITGSVQETQDPADFFIFTPARSGTYLVYLCATSCTDIVVDDQVYLMAYDQSQTTIAGTPVGTMATQQFAVELSAGLAYYVAIHGYDTGPQPYPYRLVIIN